MEKKQGNEEPEDKEQEDKEQEDKEQEDKEQEDSKPPDLPPGYIWVTSVDDRGQDTSYILSPPDPDKKGKQNKFRRGRKKFLEEHHKNQRFLDLNVGHVCRKLDGKSAPSPSFSHVVPVPDTSTSLNRKRHFEEKKFEAKRKNIKQFGDNYDQLNEKGKPEHSKLLEETAKTMDEAKQTINVTETMTKICCELVRSKLDPENPLNIFPSKPNTNIWCDINNYALKNQKTLFDLLQLLMNSLETRTTPKDVIETASALATLQALSSGNHQNVNAVLKMNTVFFDSKSLTNRGLDMESRACHSIKMYKMIYGYIHLIYIYTAIV